MLFSEKQQEVLYYLESPKFSDISEAFYGGAAGGGKTFIGCHWQIARRLQFPGTRGLIARNERANLMKTTMATFFDVWNTYYKDNPSGITINLDGQKDIIFFSNGSWIYLMGIKYIPRYPDYEYLGSLELTDAFYDEVTEIPERGYDVCNSRIRYRLDLVGNVQKSLACGNPSSNWVRSRWVLDDNLQPVKLAKHRAYVQAKVDDNPNKTFVKSYKKNLEKLPVYDRLRLLDGDWTVQINDSPWLPEFNSNMISNTIIPEDNEPILLSFDFNYDPCTLSIQQKLDPEFYPNWGHFTYASLSSNEGTQGLCNKILAAELNEHPGGFKFTGDVSGNQRRSNSNYTDWDIVMDMLDANSYQGIYYKGQNDRHVYSQSTCNYLLKNCPTLIHSSNTSLINDMRIAKTDNSGNLYKNREQGYGMDYLDNWRYGVSALFPKGSKDIRKFVEMGEMYHGKRQ